MRRTPIYEEHVRAGARMVEFAGWQMPVQYTSILDEHRAVRTAAGMFDVSHMGEVEITGPQAEACCLRLFTNDVRKLAPGRAHYSLIANEHGGLVDDVIIYRLASNRFLVCVNASNCEKDVAWMRAHAIGGCEQRDRSDELGLIAVQGPAALALVARCGPEVSKLPRFGCASISVAGAPVIAARTGYTGEDGVELFVGAEHAAELWRSLRDAGEGSGLVLAGLGARDTLRLEAALPLYGHELGENTSPYEVRLGWVVKLDDRDMVGYEALRAARDEGVPRRLIGLEVQGGIAREGCIVLACGAEIGKVTSGSYGPTVEKAVALALVERDARETELSVVIRGKEKAVRTTRLPFYRSAARPAEQPND